MLKEFQEHIEANFAYLKRERILLALSGGIDSVVLTHLLVKCGYDIQLAHCNFKLRDQESDEDEQFVVELASELGLVVHTKSFDTQEYASVKKISIQMAARMLRYEWFESLRQEHRLRYLVTAHHLDDSLETLLINLTRGTGLAGLTGISATNGSVLRPLLPFTRRQIEDFARGQKLFWREDSSNQDGKYLRNKIRHNIVPVLKEMNPGFTGAFRQTLDHLAQSQKIIDETVALLKEDIFIPIQDNSIKIDLEGLRKFNDPIPYLYQLLKPYDFTDWKAIGQLLASQPGKYLTSATHRLVKDRNHLLLDPIRSDSIRSYIIDSPNTSIKIEAFTLTMSSVEQREETPTNGLFVDADKLVFPLRIRQRETGDFFYPLGLGGKKKVSKYFKDEKFSLKDKERAWLLCSEDQIVCILGHRLDDRFKLTEKTEKILRIEFSK